MSDLTDIEKQQKKAALREKNEPPVRPVLEEIGNSVTHGIGALLGISGFVLLLIKADTAREYLAAFFYGICLIIMFLMSCLYHAFKGGSTVKRVFRRFDYSSIYLLIGGTFAPMFLVYMGGTKGLVLFILQWCVIVLGITMTSVFGPGAMKKAHFMLYMILGWSGLMFLPHMIKHDFNLFLFILGGGLLYTIGCIPFAIKKKGAHFIWHFFVLFGAVAHWLGIFLYIY